jgi:hypothetical protein
VAIGGFAIAFSLGPLLVVLPAGAGVREAVLVVLLHSVLSTSEATAVALTSRGILMATDGLLAMVAGVVPRPHMPHHHEGEPSTQDAAQQTASPDPVD